MVHESCCHCWWSHWVVDYPCTGSAGTKFDKWELGGVVIDINCGSTRSASSLKLKELVGKFVGEPGTIISIGGIAGVSGAGTVNGINCWRSGVNSFDIVGDVVGAGA